MKINALTPNLFLVTFYIFHIRLAALSRGIFPCEDRLVVGLSVLVGARCCSAPWPAGAGGLRVQSAHLTREHAGELGQDHPVRKKRWEVLGARVVRVTLMAILSGNLA